MARANRYVSYLAAEIEPRSQANITQFERQIESAFARIERFANRRSGAGLGIVSPRASSDLARFTAGTERARNALGMTDTVIKKTTADTNAMTNSLHRASMALGVVQGPLGPLAGRLSALGNIFRSLSGITLGAVLGGGASFALAGISTQYQQVTDRLRPLFENQKELNAALRDVIGIARNTRQALEPVVDLYSKLTLAGRNAGISQERIRNITETAAKAARISGGDVQSQRAGLTQFAQGFGSGTLGGDELRSIRENTLRLAKALADGLGVPIGKLKELGAEGKLTPQVIAQALERSALQIDAEMARLPIRIGQALTIAGNNLSVFIGKVDEALGATTGLAKVILLAADNLSVLATTAGVALAAFTARPIIETFTAAGARVARLGRGITEVATYQEQLNKVSAAYKVNLNDTAGVIDLVRRAALQRARDEVVTSNQALAASKAAQEQLRKQLVLIEQQARAIRAQRGAAMTLAAANPGGAGTEAVRKANQDLLATQGARIRTQQALVALDAELAAAEIRLAAATQAVAVAEARMGNSVDVAAARMTRKSFHANVLRGALDNLKATGSGLVAFLGGPWGVAFTAAAGALIYFTTRTSAAEDAMSKLGIEAGGLAEQMRRVKVDTDDAAESLLRVSRIQAAQKAGEVMDAVRLQRAAVAADIRRGIRGQAPLQARQVGPQTGATMAAIAQANKLADAIERGGSLAINLNLELEKLSRAAPNVVPPSLVEALNKEGSSLDMLAGAENKYLETRKRLADQLRAATRAPPDLSGGAGRKTLAQLEAAAAVEAAGTNAVAKAEAHLRQVRAEGRAEMKAGTLSQAEYIERVAEATRAVKAAQEAQRSARGAAAAYNKELRAQETARDKAAKLAGVMDQFIDETPIRRLERLRDAAEAAKRQIDDLIGERVAGFDGAFSASDAEREKEKIDAAVAARAVQPFTDTLRDQRQTLAVQQQILAGREEEAQLLELRYRLEQQMGELNIEQVDELRAILDENYRINRAIEERNQLIDISANMLGETRRAFTEILKNPFDVKNIKSQVRSILDAYRSAVAEKLSLKILGDPQKEFRDRMTRAMNDAGAKLRTSGERLTSSADDLSGAAADLVNAAAKLNVSIPDVTSGGTGDSGFGGMVSRAIAEGLAKEGSAAGDVARAASDVAEGVEEIVVTARRPPKPTPIPELKESLNEFGRSIGKNLFGANSPLTSAMAKLGEGIRNLSEGAAIGSATDAVLDKLGIKSSNTGAQIGATIGGFAPEPLRPFAQIAGAIIGGVIGGALQKARKASATITGVDSDAFVSGNSGKYKQAAVGLASDVQSSLLRVADALGGLVGQFSVSIGVRDGKFRVDTAGLGRTKKGPGVLDFGEDEEAALRAAILDALQDGAISGIREGARRLLSAGKDLEAALAKALKFESVFRRLKAFTDPVGAALDDLNREFVDLYKVFQQAGASAAEFADLARLYEFERAEAIKQATKETTQVLQDFITEMTAGSSSPLGRGTVYANAKNQLDQLLARQAAGETISNEELVRALDNFQTASRELNGSRAEFYSDFDRILAIAQAGVDAGAVGGGAPADPFSPDILAAINSGNALTAEQMLLLKAGFEAMIASLAALIPGAGVPSSIGLLPGAGGVPGYGAPADPYAAWIASMQTGRAPTQAF